MPYRTQPGPVLIQDFLSPLTVPGPVSAIAGVGMWAATAPTIAFLAERKR